MYNNIGCTQAMRSLDLELHVQQPHTITETLYY